MSAQIWCEDCQSWHTPEFGNEFHDRVLVLPPCIVCGEPGRHPKCINRYYDENVKAAE